MKTSPPPPADGDKPAEVLRSQYQRQQVGSTTQYLGTAADTKDAAKHEAEPSNKGTVTTPKDPTPKEATTLVKDPVAKLVETTDSLSPAEQNAAVTEANPKVRGRPANRSSKPKSRAKAVPKCKARAAGAPKSKAKAKASPKSKAKASPKPKAKTRGQASAKAIQLIQT